MSKRMTESLIVAILKGAEAGMLIKDICRNYGIGNSTFYIDGLPPYCKH